MSIADAPAQPAESIGWTSRALIFICLLVAALWVLFPDGELALQIDSSPAALGKIDGASDTNQIVVAGSASRVLDLDLLAKIAALEDRLGRLPGVLSTQSLASASTPRTDGDMIAVDSLNNRLRSAAGRSEREALLDEALQEPLLLGRLLSSDRHAAIIQLEVFGDEDTQRELARQVKSEVAALASGELIWSLTGRPIVTSAIGTLMLEQMSQILPLGVLLFCAVIFLAFRHLVPMLGVLICVAVAMVWTLAFSVLAGWPLNLVTMVIPPLVMTLTISYCIHVISAHADKGNLAAGLATIRSPLTFSALTTAIGLGALALNSLTSIRQFAVLGMVGTLSAALAAWLLMPLLLRLMRRPPQLGPSLHASLQKLADQVSRLVVRHSRTIVKISALIFAICLLGVLQVQPGSRYIRDLPADLPERVGFERISQEFGGASRFHIDIQGAVEDVMIAPRILAEVDALQDWLEQQPEIGGTLSATNYIKRLHQTFTSGEPADYRLPDNAALTKQMLFLAAPDEMYAYTDPSFSSMRIVVRTGVTDTPLLRALLDRIEGRLKEMPAGLQFSLGGESVELTNIMEQLAGGQMRSLGIAGLVILVLLSLIFASPKVGLMAMLPNALPVVAYFAILGFSGIPLSPTTALVACIVLGIAVDDTLHFLVRFSHLARELASEEDASRAAVAEVLRPVSLTSVAVCLGFLTLLGSPFHSQMIFGVLAAITLLLAWLSDLLIAPAVSTRSSVVTLWDRMRLDLGGDPQLTIPMMSDMTQRQSKQFALNSSVRRLEEGAELIREGEEGQEIFIVLDGRIRIWTGAAESPKVLTEIGRGATLGEVGHFARKRSANATAMEPSRVLVLDSSTLERLRQRHPRIAALAYRNLNHVQAERAFRGA